MRLLSSKATVFYKRVFPLIWFGFLGFIFLGALAGAFKNGGSFSLLLFPLGMAAFGLVIMKNFVWNLVDEVWDDNGLLIVRNKGREARIDFLNIINVNHSNFTNPPSVSLTLRDPCVFGRSIKFSPPQRFLGFGEHPMITELIQRIDDKRRMAGQSDGGTPAAGRSSS